MESDSHPDGLVPLIHWRMPMGKPRAIKTFYSDFLKRSTSLEFRVLILLPFSPGSVENNFKVIFKFHHVGPTGTIDKLSKIIYLLSYWDTVEIIFITLVKYTVPF